MLRRAHLEEDHLEHQHLEALQEVVRLVLLEVRQEVLGAHPDLGHHWGGARGHELRQDLEHRKGGATERSLPDLGHQRGGAPGLLQDL